MYTLFQFCAISSTRTEGVSQWVGSLNKLEKTQIREILYSRVLRQQLYFDEYIPESNSYLAKVPRILQHASPTRSFFILCKYKLQQSPVKQYKKKKKSTIYTFKTKKKRHLNSNIMEK